MQTKVVQEVHTAPTTQHVSPARNVIETRGLRKSFGESEVLQPLNLVVPERSIFGFLGPNGAGKTTTIKILLGLSQPTSGSGEIFGMNLVDESLAIREKVGYLAQDPRFYPHMTARETLRFAARFFFDGPGEAIEARIEETLDLVGLADKADRPVKGFSGGERQRLGIAQAQVNHPDLLILDEPAAALDPIGRRDVLEVMTRLREHTTIFYSTHILEDVERVSDHVAILHNGSLVANADTKALLNGNASTYALGARGARDQIVASLSAQPWVDKIAVDTVAGVDNYQINVTDESVAEQLLLRSVLGIEGAVVASFGRKLFNLEDVFLHLVEGDRS